jgi:hypothetical protein
MRKLVFLVCALGICCNAFSQSSVATWANLNGLQAGQKIQIVELTGKEHIGTFVSVGETSISYRDSKGEASVQRADVRGVKLTKGAHRMRNILIGTAVGAGAGGGITAAAWEDRGFLGGRADGAAVGAVIGGLSGAIVGALLPSHQTVYKVSGK